MNLKEMSRNPQKITLKDPMTIEDLYSLMTEKWTPEMPGPFKFKKGLFGKSIKFNIYMQIVPTVKVKDNLVIIRRTQQSTTVGGVDIKDMSQRMSALKEGGLKKAAMGGMEYFVNICEALREILKDRTV